MAGEITLRELSPKLREFIENSGGGGSINANIKTCGFTAEQGQTTFTIPFENYIPEECYLDVKVNSTWVSPNEYTINGKEVTFGTALEAGTEVFFTVYLVGATAVEKVNANVVVENEQKQFVTAQEKSKISEIDTLKSNQTQTEQQINNLNTERGYLLSKTVSSFDSTIENGKYTLTNPTDAPDKSTSSVWTLEVTMRDGSAVYQQATCLYSSLGNNYKVYVRYRASSVWTAWKEIATIDNVYQKPISMPNGTDVKSCYETGVYRSYGWVDYPAECYDGQGVLIVTNWGGDASTGWLSPRFITSLLPCFVSL